MAEELGNKEHIIHKQVPVPRYNHQDQIKRNPDGEKGSYNDPDLYAIAVEKTLASREIQRKSGIPYGFGGLGLDWAIDNTAKTIGKHFDAHGIAKGDPVSLLHNLLTQGIRKDRVLYSMHFGNAGEAASAIGAVTPKTEEGIIIVSDYEKTLREHGISYVVVGEEFIRTIDLLQEKYPHVVIVPWHDAPKVLTERIHSITGKKYPYEVVTDENCPLYPIPRHAMISDGKFDVARETKPLQKDIPSEDIW